MTQPPSAEPTLWELHRALQQMREDQNSGIQQLRDALRGDLALMNARFEETVSKEVYQADQRLVNSRLAAVEDSQRTAARARETDQQQAANTRKWVASAFIAPLLVALLQLWLTNKVGGSP